MKSNFISLNRKITEWKWYNRPNTFRLFVHILLKANFKQKEWENIVIKRGTFVTSTDKLALELRLSRQKIRTALRHLTETKEITVLTNRQHTLITVNKYDEYQISESDNQRLTNEQPTANQQLTTTNNVNNVNNDNNVAVDNVYRICLKDEMWIEHLCMRTGKKKNEVLKIMDKFVGFLKDKGEVTTNNRRFKSSFSGFLRKYDNNQKKNRHDDLIM